jgi:Tfp pilus assembly protein PilN
MTATQLTRGSASSHASNQMWNTMPGWGIVADLLPPEIVTARRIRVIRKVTALVLALVVLLGAGGYAYAWWQVHRAGTALQVAQQQTSALLASEARYHAVTDIEGQTTDVDQKLSTLLTSDVDAARLLTTVAQASPAPSRLTKVDIEITGDGTSTTLAAPNGAESLDSSGQQQIGTITVSGLVPSIQDVAKYVDRLAQVPGIVEVFPTNQQAQRGAIAYTIDMTITGELLVAHTATPTFPTSGGK